MERTAHPPGFRFHPTDVELIKYYLKRKLMGKRLPFDVISELNIYKYSPWDLPDNSSLRSKDLQWYFFCPNERKYASGARTNRATESGYWKSTGKDRPVLCNEETIGMVKTLVFYIGRPPRGERTDWVMYEYRIQDKELADAEAVQDAHVVCKVFQKSGPGHKVNAQYGAPYSEEDWNDDANFFGLLPAEVPCNNSISVGVSMFTPGSTFGGPLSKPSPLNVLPSVDEMLPAFPDDEDFICLSDLEKDNSYMFPDHSVNNEFSNSLVDAIALFNSDGLTCLDGDNMDFGWGNLDNWHELIGGRFNESNSEGLTCLDLDGMDYTLGDLDNLPELNGVGFSFPTSQTTDYGGIDVNFVADADGDFLELNDLNDPLNFPTESTMAQDFLTDIILEPFYDNYAGEDDLAVDNFLAAQHVPVMNQLPLPLEGYNGHGDNFDLFQENSGITKTADLGFTASSNDDILTPSDQSEDETRRRDGEDS